METPSETLLRRRDVCARVGVSPATLYRLIDGRQFPAPIRIGHMARWRATAVQRWIADQVERNQRAGGAA